ncbi:MULTISPECIES: hypothetical protein [Moraxella]|uniref:Peptidase n=1 Tax=Moraxella lacunata TaxID=477 RepID=A0A1B8Q4V1_MORLA|nr:MULTISPECIES: hypothetical protein [Moraxella]MBE9577856.1 hypothetical protein [Moraxella sp. K1664]MBE9587278.1 hypothetical protein [Moraxella sp. K1630]MBE9595570.1 hypothetical protein [Moraxella sp. K2450]MDH9218138.1 hypothetical protein [Moraxella lacunata]MDI4481895.1 hypothetical protein [Moraxella lacunata]
MKKIKIFKAGKHTSMEGDTIDYTPQMLAECVASYSENLHQAPLVLGHPKHDDPAYGWVEKLELDKDNVLWAYVKDVNASFAESVNQGKHNKVSASFYLPDSPQNPKKGTLYLRHIGFLGGQVPAVKGLGSVQFAENENGTASFSEPLEGKANDDKSGKIDFAGALSFLQSYLKDNPSQAESVLSQLNPPKDDGKNDEKSEREKALEKELADLQKKIADDKAKEQASQIQDFAEGLVKSGQLPPKLKSQVVEVMTAGTAHTASFSEGGEQSLTDALKKLFSELPKNASFAELNKDNRSTDSKESPLMRDAKRRAEQAKP